jgi:hypothetical protein
VARGRWTFNLDGECEYVIERVLGPAGVTDATVLFDQIRARGDTGWWRPSVY